MGTAVPKLLASFTFAVASTAFVVAACTSSSSPAGGDDASADAWSDASSAAEPDAPVATGCTYDAGDAHVTCVLREPARHMQTAKCAFDETPPVCTKDEECPAINAGEFPFWTLCVCGLCTSDCREDADCGPGGYCSPTGTPGDENDQGYACHTCNNQCTDDTDCVDAGDGTRCIFNPCIGYWNCAPAVTTGDVRRR